VAFPSSPSANERLGEILVGKRKIDPHGLNVAASLHPLVVSSPRIPNITPVRRAHPTSAASAA